METLALRERRVKSTFALSENQKMPGESTLTHSNVDGMVPNAVPLDISLC